MLAVEAILLEIGETRGGSGDQGERFRGQVADFGDGVERGIGWSREELLDGAADIGGREGFHARAVAEMAVPIAAEARERLDDRDALAGGGTKARPVATAENPDDRTADGGREMQRPRVVAYVKARGVEERGEDGHFTVAAEPELRARATEANGLAGDGLENRGLRRVAEQQHGQGAFALEEENGLGEFRRGPSFDLDVGEAGGENGGKRTRGEFRGGENARGLRTRGSRDCYRRQRPRRGASAGEEVIDETVLVFPVGGLRRGGNDFGERTGHGHAELEAQGCGEDRIDVLRAEDDAADFRETRGDGGFEPSAV